ncbi:MAG: BadF/BadG/BcrA/BcrD ATPase family protein [Blastocatellia bacterium]|nr:BadF/BadG/BcrA/BcrD ATPase family protein [Blastocatellia bacterium]
MGYFLGIDGGQSHTTAIVADARGKIVGRGHAGASNHTREPGGRERLTQAVHKSVAEALQHADLLKKKQVAQFRFTSAHLAMTGEPEDKVDIVRELLSAEYLEVGHDAPGALAGALAGEEGVIVLAGTGSVACGMTVDGRFVRVGGHGFMFGDEGSAFAIAREAFQIALRNQDRDEPCALTRALLSHFRRPTLKEIIEAFYAGQLSRDRLASVAARIGRLADRDDVVSAQEILDHAACILAEMAVVTALRLEFAGRPIRISYGGGVFHNTRLLTRFAAEISIWLSHTQIVKPRYSPEIGALILAYRQAGKATTAKMLANMETTDQQ